MTLAQLQALAAVVELGSLTAAAERLSRSQSAISHALTELEDLTGVKLLLRDRQPVVLTASGERLWPYVQNVVRDAHTLRQQFALSRGKLEGRLVVASLPSVSLAFVVPALEALKAAHAGVTAVLLEGTDAEVEGWIDDGTADIGVVAGAKTFPNTLPLLDEEFVAVTAPDLFEGRHSVSPKRLAALPFIFSKAGCGPVIAITSRATARAARGVQRGRDAHDPVDGGSRDGRLDRPRITLTYSRFGGRVLELSPRLHRSVRLAWKAAGNAVVDEFVGLVDAQRARTGKTVRTRAKKAK
jgi:DNA-binding transcriptional LysR family regulator